MDEQNYMQRVLVETDRLYFELGATRSSDSGLDLLYIPDHVASPSGAVVWGVDRSLDSDRFREMLDRVEAELAKLGGRMMRIYVENEVPPSIASACHQAGYTARVEVALFATTDSILATPVEHDHLRFVKVETEEQWRSKERIHANCDHQPDGYPASAERWVDLERTKCGTGAMSFYLALDEDVPVATVGLLRDRGIARLKNLLVRPESRGGGVAVSTIRLLAAEAHALGYRKFGAYAVEGGRAIRSYRRASLRVVAAATEFSKELA